MASAAPSSLRPGSERVGPYELGTALGAGRFSKVRAAVDARTGKSVAVKIVDKRLLRELPGMDTQVVREISTMRLLGRHHPNIVPVYEVVASKSKIYIVMELMSGGSLERKIERKGKLQVAECRKYFQQLISAVDYCHRKGVYHRDLKPHNLLFDDNGNLKLSDFGLSASFQQVGTNGLLRTRCGTPNFAAPEVIMKNNGYDGAKADVWSCGVILFYLLAGYLPFQEESLAVLYDKILNARYSFPVWIGSGARNLIMKILEPDPQQRISTTEILDEWFKIEYKPTVFPKEVCTYDVTPATMEIKRPSIQMNAFELISTSEGLNLGILFERPRNPNEWKRRFASKCPEILSRIKEATLSLNFNVQEHNNKLIMRGNSRGSEGQLVISTEVFEVAPSFYVVQLCKMAGDAVEFQNFYCDISAGLGDAIWKAKENDTDKPSMLIGSEM